tara:strand:+ start:1607 stop:2158 length:552 start_codon:yes stop_codon:yes gene_type:complete
MLTIITNLDKLIVKKKPTKAEKKHMDEWVPCYGWESFYEVSRSGSVRSKKTLKEIKPILKNSGYMCVNIFVTGFKRKQELVHRIVAQSFLGECKKPLEVCHNDGDRSNNAIVNLRIDTRSNNHADKEKHGTKQNKMNNGQSKFSVGMIKNIRNGFIKRADAISMGMSATQFYRVLKMEGRIDG